MRSSTVDWLSLVITVLLVGSYCRAYEGDVALAEAGGTCSTFEITVNGVLPRDQRIIAADDIMMTPTNEAAIAADIISPTVRAQIMPQGDQKRDVFARFRRTSDRTWLADGFVGIGANTTGDGALVLLGRTVLTFDSDGRLETPQEVSSSPIEFGGGAVGRIVFRMAELSLNGATNKLVTVVNGDTVDVSRCSPEERIDDRFEATGGIASPEAIGIKDHPDGDRHEPGTQP